VPRGRVARPPAADAAPQYRYRASCRKDLNTMVYWYWGECSTRPYHIRGCILFQEYPSTAGRTSESAITCYWE